MGVLCLNLRRPKETTAQVSTWIDSVTSQDINKISAARIIFYNGRIEIEVATEKKDSSHKISYEGDVCIRTLKLPRR